MHLLPRDEKFFDLMVEQAKIVFDASRLLADGLAGAGRPDFRGMAQKIRDLERKGDEAARQIYRRLHKTFAGVMTSFEGMRRGVMAIDSQPYQNLVPQSRNGSATSVRLS